MSLSSISSTALSGIFAAEAMLDVTANNLANLQTPGFKQSQVVLATQTPSGTAPGLQVGTGVQVVGVVHDLSQGAVVPAGSPLNLAVEGEGYFVLEDAEGQRVYTRDGAFGINADGQLVSAQGYRVLGWQGERSVYQGELVPLFILDGREGEPGRRGEGPNIIRQLQIDSYGQIRGRFSNGTRQLLGQVRLARFSNPNGLRALGHNSFAATASSGMPRTSNPGARGMGRLVSHHLEASNTSAAQNLIGMSRAELLFRANLRVLQVADQLWLELLQMDRR